MTRNVQVANVAKKNYAKLRYVVYFIISVCVLTMPFLTIDSKHLFLLSFDKLELHLFFVSFSMQELYLMPFLLIMLFLGIFFMTTLGGRVWCGWSCPQTIFRVFYRDFIQTKLLKIRKNISNKQKEPKGENLKQVVGFLIWCVLAFVAASNFLWYFVPPEDFFQYIQNPQDHKVLIGFVACIAAFLIYDITSMKENFCIYVCPYARVQSVMYDDDTIQTIYNTKRGGIIYDNNGKLISSRPKGKDDECTGCEACVKICPTHIDIRKGMQLECINCLECSDACTKVMGKLGKETLISWISPNAIKDSSKVKFVRLKTIAYAIALFIVFGLLLFTGSKKEHMQLNINRTTQLYKIHDNGQIDNIYTFLFENTTNQPHTYYFKTNNNDIFISRPKDSFTLKPGQKRKEIVVLSTTKNLAINPKEDTKIELNINAFAKDDLENINVDRKAVFIYPAKKQ